MLLMDRRLNRIKRIKNNYLKHLKHGSDINFQNVHAEGDTLTHLTLSIYSSEYILVMSLSSQLMLTPSITDTLYASMSKVALFSVMLMRKISLKIQNVFRHSLGSLLNKLLVSSIDEPSCHQNTRYKLVLQTLYLFSLVRNSFWLTDKQNGRHLPPPWWKVLMHWSDIST